MKTSKQGIGGISVSAAQVHERLRRDAGRRRMAAACAAVLPLLAAVATPTAQADNLYWDSNGTDTGSSNTTTGTWGTSDNWTTDAAGTATPGAWVGGSTAVFSAGTNATGGTTIAVSGTQSVAGLVFEESTITLNGPGSLDFGTANFTIENKKAATHRINVPIVGSGDLTINNTSGGDGVVNLSGQMSGFTGNIILGAGTSNTQLNQLQLDWPLGNPAKTIFLNSYSLLGNTNPVTLTTPGGDVQTPNNYTIANPIQLLGSDAWISSSRGAAPDGSTPGTQKVVTYAGTISGTGNLWVGIRNGGGRGTVVLGDANTARYNYPGNTHIVIGADDGLVQLGKDNILPATTNLVFGSPAALNGNVGPFDMNGHSLTVASLAHANTGTGSVAGIFNTVNAPVTLTIDGATSTTFKGVIGNTDTGINPFNRMAPYSSTVNSTNVVGYTNISLVKNGSGTLTLTASNQYTGETVINGGAISLGRTGIGAVTLASPVTINSGGTLTSVASPNATPVGGTSGNVTLNSGGFITPGGAGATASIASTGGFAFNSGGQITFDIASLSNFDQLLFTGGLTLDSAGTHRINVAGSNLVAGTYTLIKADGGISWDGANGFVLGTTPTGGGSTFSLTQTDTELQLNILANALRWDLEPGGPAITEGGGAWTNGVTQFTDLSNNGVVTWSNAAGNDVIIGADVNQVGGQIDLGSAIRAGGKITFGPVFPGTGYTISDGGQAGRTLTVVGGIVANSSTTIDANVVLGGTQTWAVDAGQTLTVNKSLTQAGGAHTLSKTGAGTVALMGAGGNVGAVNVTGGTLALGAVNAVGTAPITIDGGNLGLGASGNFTNTITFGANGGGIGPANGAEVTLAGNLSSTGLVTVGGAGTLTLTGTNNFAGGVRLTSGTVSIASAAALGGGGTIAFNGTAANNATLAITAPLTLPNNMTFTGTTAPNNNRLDLAADVTFSGALSGTGDWFKYGTGNITFTGANSLTNGAVNFNGATTLNFAPGATWGTQTMAIFAPTVINPQADLSIGAVRGTSTFTKTGGGKLTVSGSTGVGGADPALQVIVDGGAVQMNSLTSLGGNNGTNTAPLKGAHITLNAGTQLLTNWGGSRNSQNITLNNASLVALASSGGEPEFSNYLTNAGVNNNFGGVFTVNGSSLVHNQMQAVAGGARGLLIHMPVVVSSGATLTLQADNTAGNHERAAVVLRGVSNNTVYPGDNVALRAGSTLITQGQGEVHLGGTGRGKPILAEGTPGSDAVMKLGSHTFLRDNGSAADRTGGTEMTKLVVAGSGNAGLRVEAPMNATYTVPEATAPTLRTYDGTTGLFGYNTTATVNGTNLPSGYTNIGHGYTVFSVKRANALSNTYTKSDGTVVTPGGTLTLAATDAAGATGRLDAGPAAPAAVGLALDNAATSGNLIYEIDPAANGGTFGNFAKLTVQRTHPSAGGVTAKLLGTTKIPSIAITGGAKIDITNQKLITNNPVGTATTVVGNTRLYDGLQGLVQSAKNGDAWDGPGLTSSKAAAEGGLTTIGIANGAQAKGGIGATETALWGGQTITGSSILAMYTYAGDANLDGAITGDDYSAIDFGILFEGMDGYANGDFNYDGYVTGDDYSVIDLNILLQGPQIPTGGAVASASSAGLAGVTAVPEPSACGFALVGAAMVLRRRRRAPVRSS